MSSLRFRQLTCGVVLAGAALISPVFAQQPDLRVSADAVEATVNNTTLDASFKVKVENGGSAAVTNVHVAFADGVDAYVGDVNSGEAAESAVQHRVIDISQTPTQNVPVGVTLTYTAEGANVEQAALLIVRVN